MIVHIGNDCFVKTKDILMILDYKEAVSNKETGLFLEGIKQTETGGGAPRSIVITDEDGVGKAYFSPISARTLAERVKG
ncbi:MAG: DUF370 domain-containing protein [Christensenella sp.]